MSTLTHKPLGLTTRFDARSDKIDANTLNVMLDTIKQLSGHSIAIGSGVSGFSSSLGSKLLIPKGLEIWTGIVVSEGPNKEKDFPDARYWTSIAYADNHYTGKEPSKHVNDQIEFKKWKEKDLLYRVVPVTNLAEIDVVPDRNQHTHALPEGLHILVLQIRDRSRSLTEPKFGPFLKYYTWAGFPTTMFVVVRTIPGDDSKTVGVQQVIFDKQTEKHKMIGEEHPVFCYPGTLGRHFTQLLTPENITEVTSVVTVLEKQLIGSQWYVFPRSRRGRTDIDPQEDMELSDCVRIAKGSP